MIFLNGVLAMSFLYEWEVVMVWFAPCGNRAMSKHSDWLSDDFARCDWLNRCLRFRTVTVTPCRNVGFVTYVCM